MIISSVEGDGELACYKPGGPGSIFDRRAKTNNKATRQPGLASQKIP
jgi:hypothetical protein